MSHKKPLVAVTADRSISGLHPIHSAGEKYLAAVSSGAGCMPIVVPAMADDLALDDLLQHIDGVLLTGGYSNIQPHHYKQQPLPGEDHIDPQRDTTNLSLIPRILEAGIPLLGICRGLQELNVALGGTLHQRVHEVKGFADHREDKTAPIEVQYGVTHTVQIQPNGVLSSLYHDAKPMVNSVHGQGIDRLAEGLQIEATAEDGLVEAVSVPSAKQFALAVQWHPEWQVQDNPFYLAIFKAFGQACQNYRQTKT